MTQSNQISAIVDKYLESTNLSMRHFASMLGISHAAISNWAAGKSEPNVTFLFNCRDNFSDWRFEFATAILKEILPNIFGNDHKPETLPGLEGGEERHE